MNSFNSLSQDPIESETNESSCTKKPKSAPQNDRPAPAPEETILYPLPREIQTIATEKADGHTIVHDMTRIEPGKSKGPAFHMGGHFAVGDLCRLQQMGRNQVYVSEKEVSDNWVHENDCAKAFARAMAGTGILADGAPSEGKVTLRAAHDGLLRVFGDRLYAFNSCPGVMAASRRGWTRVRKNDEIAGTRAIPLYLERQLFDQACRALDAGPVFEVLPLRKAQTGVLITGDEVFYGTIEDRFEEIIRSKLAELDCILHKTIVVPDEREAIRDGALALLDEGCDLIITTAGLSVDPGDVTRHGLVDAGAGDLLYGMPILPGAMTLIGRIGPAQLLGVPACALFFKRTSMDRLLPRLLASVEITRDDLARMGEGGLCLNCPTCHFPDCPFGG